MQKKTTPHIFHIVLVWFEPILIQCLCVLVFFFFVLFCFFTGVKWQCFRHFLSSTVTFENQLYNRSFIAFYPSFEQHWCHEKGRPAAWANASFPCRIMQFFFNFFFFFKNWSRQVSATKLRTLSTIVFIYSCCKGISKSLNPDRCWLRFLSR